MGIFRRFLGIDPPLGKWVYYQDYVMRWRDEWKDKVRIVAHHPMKPMIKLEMIDYGNL